MILLCTSRSAWRFYSEANGTLSYKKDCKKKNKKKRITNFARHSKKREDLEMGAVFPG